MTVAVPLDRVESHTPTTSPAIAVVAVGGCAVLAARPALIATTRQGVPTLTVLFVGLLVVGWLLPLPRVSGASGSPHARWVAGAAFVFGVGAFALGRVAGGGHAPATWSLAVVASNTLAAFAEEVWFRRVWFALLEPAGPSVAIVGSALLFALVHVATYGMWVVPLDVAAGLVLGWQRWVTGSWTVPAYTHALANVLMLL